METGYSAYDLERIKKATDYQELLTVAKKVLRHMTLRNQYKPIVILCGPISTGGAGSRKENLKIFSKAIERAKTGGLYVFSQMPFEDDMDRIYKSDPNLQGTKLLEEFYLPLFQTGLIKILMFLPGWQESVGATWEHRTAEKLDIPRIYLAESYVL